VLRGDLALHALPMWSVFRGARCRFRIFFGLLRPPSEVNREVNEVTMPKMVVIERGVAGRAGAVRAIASSAPPHACPRQGRRRPEPSFFTAGTGGVAVVQTCASGGAPAAKLRPTTKIRRKYIAAMVNLPLYR
jgi:hypothetical protein